MNYKKIYDSIIEFRQNNKFEGYVERHHIVPRSLGGSDEQSNLVDLTAREHYICHLLLSKIYNKGTSEYYKMIKAYNMMCFAKNLHHVRDYKINSRIYASLRQEFSKGMSISQRGKNNSQYEKIWIYSNSLRKSKKVDNGYVLTGDWQYGRRINFEYLDRCCNICNENLNLTKNCSKNTLCKSCYLDSKFLNSKNEIKISDVKLGKKSFKYGKKCYCDGVLYNSIAEASFKLSIQQETLRYRIKSKNPNYKNYYYV